MVRTGTACIWHEAPCDLELGSRAAGTVDFLSGGSVACSRRSMLAPQYNKIIMNPPATGASVLTNATSLVQAFRHRVGVVEAEERGRDLAADSEDMLGSAVLRGECACVLYVSVRECGSGCV